MSGLIGGGQPSAPPPTIVQAPPTPTPIPIEDTSLTEVARKKAAAARQQQGGVASSVLSDTLGA